VTVRASRIIIDTATKRLTWFKLRTGLTQAWRTSLVLFVLALGGITLHELIGAEIGGWSLGELLVNYEGGFVRRGLFGQIFLATGAPAASAFLTQMTVILIFYVGSAALLATWKGNLSATAAFTVAVFAPGGLFDMSSSGTFEYLDRKEIWFYVALLFLIFYVKSFGMLRPSSLGISVIVSCTMILHHELFFLFFAIPISGLLILLAINVGSKKSLLFPASYFAFTTFTFLLVVLNRGTSLTAESILLSLEGTDAGGVSGGINAIGWDFSLSNQLSIRMLSEGSSLYWLFFLLVASLLAANLIVVSSDRYLSLIGSTLLLGWLFVAVALSATAGWDWGRWISMFSISFFLLQSLVQVFESECGKMERVSNSFLLAATPFQHKSVGTVVLSSIVLGFSALLSSVTNLAPCCPRPIDEIWGLSIPSFIFRLLPIAWG